MRSWASNCAWSAQSRWSTPARPAVRSLTFFVWAALAPWAAPTPCCRDVIAPCSVVSVDFRAESWAAVSALFPPGFDKPAPALGSRVAGDARGSGAQVGLKVLFDPERKVVHDKYGTRLFPETWVIDKDGVIRLRIDGRRNWSDALALDVIRSFE